MLTPEKWGRHAAQARPATNDSRAAKTQHRNAMLPPALTTGSGMILRTFYVRLAEISIVALPEGLMVQLMLITGDDSLADGFVEELAQRDTKNPILRVHTFDEGIDQLSKTAPGKSPQIIILDLRNAVREGTRFLAEVHNHRPFNEPVIFIIGAGENEAEILKGNERFIAGQLPETGAGAAFVDWAVSMLSENWSFERTLTDT